MDTSTGSCLAGLHCLCRSPPWHIVTATTILTSQTKANRRLRGRNDHKIYNLAYYHAQSFVAMSPLISAGAFKQQNKISQAKPSFESPSLKAKRPKGKGMSPHCRQDQGEGTWAALTQPLSSRMSCHGLSLQVHSPAEPSAPFLSYWCRCGEVLSSYCIFIRIYPCSACGSSPYRWALFTLGTEGLISQASPWLSSIQI